jgi:flagellar biosynthesis protein FlhG
VPEAVRRQQAVIELAPATPATRAIEGLAERLCAAPTQAKAKGGLQFFFRRLLAGGPAVEARR